MSRILLPALMLVALTACGVEDSFPVPQGFQAVGSENHDLRAVTADDSALTILVEDAEDADLEFFRTLLKRQIADNRGYEVKVEDAQAFGSLTGHAITAETVAGGSPVTFFAACAIHGDKVITVQYAGRAELAEVDLPKVRRAIADWPL